MIVHIRRTDQSIRREIRNGEISFAGNQRLKIYGKLGCKSGKRMKSSNRVFFKNEPEAIARGFRPCGHCMKEAYNRWKNETI